jgi:23S rRNA pseudoU1915 N3-methylase RlmH
MEKSVLKGKKEIRLLIVDSLHQTVQALGVTKSKRKTERVINKSAKRIAELVAEQMKKELKKIKEEKEKKAKAPKAAKPKKAKKIKEPDLEIA